MRTEPPPSLAVASGIIDPAIAAEEPPLDPPGVRSRFHGLRASSKSRFLVIAVAPNSGALVLPTTIAPAARSRSTWSESRATRLSLKTRQPWVVTRPAASSRSFTPSGHAFERPRFAALDARFGAARVGEQRIAVAHRDEGVELAVHRVDAVERRLHQLDGGELAAREQRGDLGERTAQQITHVGSPEAGRVYHRRP